MFCNLSEYKVWKIRYAFAAYQKCAKSHAFLAQKNVFNFIWKTFNICNRYEFYDIPKKLAG
jgi:hypothetical protein